MYKDYVVTCFCWWCVVFGGVARGPAAAEGCVHIDLNMERKLILTSPAIDAPHILAPPTASNVGGRRSMRR